MPDIVLTRRRVLAWLGGLGLAALIPGCADEGDSAAPTATIRTATRSAPRSVIETLSRLFPACVLLSDA